VLRRSRAGNGNYASVTGSRALVAVLRGTDSIAAT
jgi:hypothetical protein